MLITCLIFLVLVGIAITCDFTPYTLDDDEVALLYSDEHLDVNENSGVFGNSFAAGQPAEADLQSDDVKNTAEELLNKIYNG